jgi:hypothetical protein
MKNETTFRRGTRVILTKLKTKHLGETGTVTGIGHDDCLWVRWDGLKTPYSYHPNFLKLAMEDQPHEE